MGDRMVDPCERQILLKLVDIPSDLLDLSVLRLGEVPEKQVDLYAIVGKLGRHLLTNESIRELCDLQATVDSVVVGEGYVAHPLFFQPAVQHPRIRIAIGKLEAAKNPFRGSIAEL